MRQGSFARPTREFVRRAPPAGVLPRGASTRGGARLPAVDSRPALQARSQRLALGASSSPLPVEDGGPRFLTPPRSSGSPSPPGDSFRVAAKTRPRSPLLPPAPLSLPPRATRPADRPDRGDLRRNLLLVVGPARSTSPGIPAGVTAAGPQRAVELSHANHGRPVAGGLAAGVASNARNVGFGRGPPGLGLLGSTKVPGCAL